MQRDYWYTVARDPAELEAVARIGRTARPARAARDSARGGCRRASAPVVFAPEMARGLFGHFIGAIRGASQYRKASFLLDAAGEQVFPTFI